MADAESDSDWDGVESSGASKGKAKAAEEEQEEYEDEEQLATVTVVEEFDPDTLIHGDQPLRKPQLDEDEDEPLYPKAKSKPNNSAQTKARLKTTAKVKEIKYQTGAARKAERSKQHKRKLEKAERAGGKVSKRKGGAKGRR